MYGICVLGAWEQGDLREKVSERTKNEKMVFKEKRPGSLWLSGLFLSL
jgi:hypothetical protein